MKVLVVGGGAREHALVWKLAQSPKVTEIFCAPGNPGISRHAECLDIKATDLVGLLKFAMNNAIDMTVVGPEQPLVDGIVDLFKKRGLRIFGPTQRAARLEASKSYAKEVMGRHGIPTGYSKVFRDFDVAEQYLRTAEAPLVIKADGLAAGKGVIIAKTIEEAIEAARQILWAKAFGEEAGSAILVEEFLDGEEVSAIAISDGHTIVPFDLAQDHKAIGEGDTGPNTGGMGTYSPLPQIREEVREEIERECVVQTIHAMNREGEEFRGCLFTGLIVTDDGPRVLEFNVRFGDPETQSLVRRLKSDLFPLLWHACDGTLEEVEIEWDDRVAVNIVLAAGGYPGKLEQSQRIYGLDKEFDPDVVVFHGGTKRESGAICTAGGRVLSISAIADTLAEALELAYDAAAQIEFGGKQVRKDIGYRGLRALDRQAERDAREQAEQEALAARQAPVAVVAEEAPSAPVEEPNSEATVAFTSDAAAPSEVEAPVVEAAESSEVENSVVEAPAPSEAEAATPLGEKEAPKAEVAAANDAEALRPVVEATSTPEVEAAKPAEEA